MRKIGRLMLPAIFGSSVSQVALLLDTLIASFLATGSIAWLYYADRLMEFPLGVFSIALATVILPGLAAHHSAESPARFTATLDWALRLTIIVVLPATAALVVLAGPLTVTIFHYGRFDENDVRMSALALMAYASGPARIQPGQGACAGILRATGHEDPGSHRHPVAGRQHRPQPGRRACRSRSPTTAPACTRCSRSTTASAPGTTRACSIAGCVARACSSTHPAGGACCCRWRLRRS